MTVSRVGLAAVASFVALSGLTLSAALVKVLVIAWIAFAAMAGAAALGRRVGADERVRPLVWGYGLASGAMITSAGAFLVPPAVGHHPEFGGFGIALGLLSGFGAHTIGHRVTHVTPALDHTAAELTAHSLAAGAIIGIVYANLPDLGLLLGLAIVSHKGPAGFAAAHRLRRAGKPVSVLLLPASGVGIAAILSGLFDLPNAPAVSGVVFGFAAGVFLHVAMDFLPRCELGGDVYEVASLSTDAHEQLDRLRGHAVASTALGAVAVLAAWGALR